VAGYSPTPLPAKLGIKPLQTRVLIHAPPHYSVELGLPITSNIDVHDLQGSFDWIQAFYSERALLGQEISVLKAHLTSSGQLWLSWPKQALLVNADLKEQDVRSIGLEVGLVDVKVAAINQVWSGLKFVFRRQDR